jgi:hypothetical protein
MLVCEYWILYVGWQDPRWKRAFRPENTIKDGDRSKMSDDVQKPTIVTNLRESVSSGINVRDSEGFAKPANLKQPDVIALPTAAPQGQGSSQTVATQSVAGSTNSTSKGE